MLEIGTKVFINRVFRQHRPSPTGYERDSLNCYGTVKSVFDDDYYEVNVINNVTGELFAGCFYRHEMATLGHHEPTYRVGDMVYICDISKGEKQQYPPGWCPEMDEYIGQTARVTGHVDRVCHMGRNDYYQLEGNTWVWDASNLKPVSEFVGY